MIINNKVKIINIFNVLILSLCLFSCSFSRKTSSDKQNESKLLVLTTFTILADIASNIAGDRLEVKSITKPGAEIHSYQFTPSDIISASNADLIIENGLGLELWIEKFISSAGNIPRLVLSEGMKPIPIEGDVYAGKPNPHAWMSPQKTLYYVDKILKAFVNLDPEGKEIFIDNANVYKSKLLSLDKELRDNLNLIPKNKRFLVTCEGAFSYLANDYDMQEAYLWPVNAESQVTPKRMILLIKTIKENNIPTIFCESTVSARAQREVAKASGASFGGKFYVDSLSEEDGPAPTLLDLHRYNSKLILKGLSPTKLTN